MRIIIQNPNDLPDYVIAIVMLGTLPLVETAVYDTPVGKICAKVVERRKSRVYTIFKNREFESKPITKKTESTPNLFDHV